MASQRLTREFLEEQWRIQRERKQPIRRRFFECGNKVCAHKPIRRAGVDCKTIYHCDGAHEVTP